MMTSIDVIYGVMSPLPQMIAFSLLRGQVNSLTRCVCIVKFNKINNYKQNNNYRKLGRSQLKIKLANQVKLTFASQSEDYKLISPYRSIIVISPELTKNQVLYVGRPDISIQSKEFRTGKREPVSGNYVTESGKTGLLTTQ
ncbi:Hypothetical_protein [Hexamita inflata]|uniref:Hypothetical_protein n=1 Tax=Hexamita inflata TaxID=28002 RepID=A0AA86TR39_9EUKA|nr:Hypothetical protein HINF_LOCUS11252 [Hexamita inflata]